jgi:hypothetical protein
MSEFAYEKKPNARSFRYLLLIGTVLLPILFAVWYFAEDSPPPPREQPVSPPLNVKVVDLQETPLDWIPPGTVIEKSAPEGWSHVVYVARPRIGSGDVNKVSKTVLHYAALYTVNCLADVQRHAAGLEEMYRLGRVAIGIGTEIDGKNTIITSATQKKLGADLDLIARQVLSQCESDFQNGFLQIVRTPTMLVYDSNAILLIENRHKKMMTRHAILVSPKTGRMHTLVWLFDPNYELVEQPLRLLPPNYQEDRVMNVDADKFLLGLPRDGAFAQLRLAQGTPILLTDQLEKVLSPRRYTKKTAHELERQLRMLISGAN